MLIKVETLLLCHVERRPKAEVETSSRDTGMLAGRFLDSVRFAHSARNDTNATRCRLRLKRRGANVPRGSVRNDTAAASHSG